MLHADPQHLCHVQFGPAGGVFLVPQLCIAHPLTRQCFIMSKLVHQVLHYVNQCLLASELQPKLVKAPHRLSSLLSDFALLLLLLLLLPLLLCTQVFWSHCLALVSARQMMHP
jgi:hypothetical protein